MQNATAFQQDIGITSNLLPHETCQAHQDSCLKAPSGGTPEVSQQILDRVTFYTRLLAVPAQRDWNNENVIKGKQIFHSIGCHLCHTPQQKTAVHAAHPQLENQTFYPYTDLLLHDMGTDLADHADKSEMARLWRTPPLWGIGLLKTINGNAFYLHDGRARTIEEAILWHGGEAKTSRNAYINLKKKQREDILSFLDSL